MQPNAATSAQCMQPLSNWRRSCESPSLNPSIDKDDVADVLANGDSYLRVGESISLTLVYSAPTVVGTFTGTHTLLGSRITDDQTNGDSSSWTIETTIVVVPSTIAAQKSIAALGESCATAADRPTAQQYSACKDHLIVGSDFHGNDESDRRLDCEAVSGCGGVGVMCELH